MDYSMNYQAQQEQRAELFMTMELRQAIHLLQYSTLDLYSHVQQQLVENPMLEIKERAEKYHSPWRSISEFHALEQKKSLRDICKEQLLDFELGQAHKFFCKYIIDNLDEDGYLYLDSTEMCQLFRISMDEWNKVVKVVQSMEPTGIGARSLKECIQLQLRKQRVSELAEKIAESFLEEVSKGKVRVIASSLNVSTSDVEKAIREIRSCDPRPGSLYIQDVPQYIYPDIIIHKVGNAHYVSLNEAIIPPLTINQKYKELIREPRYCENVKCWHQSASWLIRGIEQRRQTIIRVVENLFLKQALFLEKGVEYLKPLTLQEIALELEIHESTVSRVTQHKYVQTPRGTFPLRYFFSSGIEGINGQVWSSTYVKQRIADLINNENKQKPYSDQKLADLLHHQGIGLSRRTVTKYREDVGILSSRVRKMS